jgi:hypothetical protein
MNKFLSFFPAVLSLVCFFALYACSDNAAKERERLQKEITDVRDSFEFYQKEFLEKYNKVSLSSIRSGQYGIERNSDPGYLHNQERIIFFRTRLDSLTLRLRELPPPK